MAKKSKTRYPKIEFDKLQIYFGEPYTIDCESADGSIEMCPPTIGDIIRLGEKRFYETLNVFITNTTSYRLALWDNGIDWNELSDFQLFTMLYTSINDEVSKIIFPNTTFSNFKLLQKDGKEIVLYDVDNKIEINEEVYQHMAQYLRLVFNTNIEEKLTKSKALKEMYIEKDRREKHNSDVKTNKGEESSNSIQSVISACVNHPGFKYKLKELKDVSVSEFYDSVKRLQVYEQTTSLMKGMYSGMIDGSKIKQEDTNFMRDI